MVGQLGFVIALLLALPPMSPQKWRADVDYLARELPKRHKNAFHRITREQFNAGIETLRVKAARGNDNEMLAALFQFMASIGDGHTRVNPKPGLLHGFPIFFAEFEGAYRVIRAAGPAADLAGARLTKIDDTPVDEVVKRVRTLITQGESDLLIEARTAQWFTVAEALNGLGITKSAQSARYTVELDDGSERTVELQALEDGAKPEWRLAAQKQPLYRQKPGETFWFEWLPEARTVYVSFRGDKDIRAKSRELWAFVDEHPVKKIAFDIRQNGGGDYTLARKYLVDELARRPKIRGFALISTQTFSAALKAAIDFRQVAKATLAGETIGERPNSYSENDEMTLPNSKIELSYSTRYHEFLPGSNELLKPDKEIHATWDDWVAGRDPVLEWVLHTE